jgi:hypothetical protein
VAFCTLDSCLCGLPPPPPNLSVGSTQDEGQECTSPEGSMFVGTEVGRRRVEYGSCQHFGEEWWCSQSHKYLYKHRSYVIQLYVSKVIYAVFASREKQGRHSISAVFTRFVVYCNSDLTVISICEC